MRTTFRSAVAAVCAALVLGCGGGGGPGGSGGAPVVPPAPPEPPAPPPPPPAPPQANPILFVTQVPTAQGFGSVVETFNNHRPSMTSCPRGGGLWVRYPDGALKNLTQAAGFGEEGMQGAGAIACREPCVHWSGAKAVFSMVVGAPTQQYQTKEFLWQLYEVSGLGKDDTPTITKVPFQPAYNNVSPCYASDGRILFASDRPRDGQAHLHPQLDEYESAPVVTGIWSLDPGTGALFLMNHAPSGAFSVGVDTAGRVVFTRWDHLLRDQQADAERQGGYAYGTFDWSDESVASVPLATATEVFPAPRKSWVDYVNTHPGYAGDLAGWKPHLVGIAFNLFQPWAMNQDGTDEETINHVGRHEVAGYVDRAFDDDPNLVDFVSVNPNSQNQVRYYQGFFQLREDPTQPGEFLGVDSPEFGFHASGRVMRLHAPKGLDADQVTIVNLTHPDTSGATPTPEHTGRYRSPLVLTDGTFVCVHSTEVGQDQNDGTSAAPTSRYPFRLKTMAFDGTYWKADAVLTPGLQASVSWWSPDVLTSWQGTLWELDPVEVVARPVPPSTTAPTIPAPEASMLTAAGVSAASLSSFLVQNDLALVVSRDVTTRDRSDRQQPFNLKVAGTAHQTVGASGKVYDVAYLQLVQGDLLRGLGKQNMPPPPGRRVLGRFLHEAKADHPPPSDGSAPAGSVEIEDDGSVAALVPARRAMSWQLVDEAGEAVVQERYWVTFQPGEVRVCASCHGANQKDQAGSPPPTNAPKALQKLLAHLKSKGKVTGP